MTVGQRLRERREAAGLTGGQVSQYEGIGRQYLSKLELGTNEPPGWELIARLARRYGTSTDYLLGLTDNPTPADVEVEPLEEDAYQLLEIWNELGPGRREEWIARGRYLEEEERQADLREYDRLMALIAAATNGELATETAFDALRAHSAGDRAGAWQLIHAFLAGFAEMHAAKQGVEVQTPEQNVEHV